MDDSLILQKFAEQSTREEAFRLLLKKYQQKIYWHVRRLVIDHDDADDIVQDVFIKVWKNLENFRENAQLYTWIYRIATNESITFLNKKKQRAQISLEDESAAYLTDSLSEGSHFNGNRAQQKLQEALLTLPEKQRLVFNMKYFDDLKYEEISEILGTSVGGLKASYHIAVKKIEQYFNESD